MQKIAFITRKYDPREWGGIETYLLDLLPKLKSHGFHPIVFAPALKDPPKECPLKDAGIDVRRYKSFLPILGLSKGSCDRLISLGGNIVSFDLMWQLFKEKDLKIIDLQTAGRIGAMSAFVAKCRKIPLYMTVHGGILSMPQSVKEKLIAPSKGGFDWGKILGFLFGARSLVKKCDRVLCFVKEEKELLDQKYGIGRAVYLPKGINQHYFSEKRSVDIQSRFPELKGKELVFFPGRVDRVKNQLFVLERLPEIIKQFPNAFFIFTGSITDPSYGEVFRSRLQDEALAPYAMWTGPLSVSDPFFVSLYQSSKVTLLPSIIETCPLTVMEAWAALSCVVASDIEGNREAIDPGRNGLLFPLNHPEKFDEAVVSALKNNTLRDELVKGGFETLLEKYTIEQTAKNMANQYRQAL